MAEDRPDDAVTAIDCVVLGSRTYEHALQLGWPYGDTGGAVLSQLTSNAATGMPWVNIAS